jgi:maleate isomerase
MTASYTPPGIHYGTRAKLGFMIPSLNVAVEGQLPAMCPPGVSLHITRLKLNSSKKEDMERMADNLEDAADMLADAGVDVITFHCTGVTTLAPDMDERLINRIVKATGRKATATGRALGEALKLWNAKKIVLLTPYPQFVNDNEIAFLNAKGVEVIKDVALDIRDAAGMFDVTPEDWIRLGIENRNDQADAYFISCAAVRSAEAIDRLEAELGKPVITSNQVSFWHALRLAGIKDSVQGFGRLLSKH